MEDPDDDLDAQSIKEKLTQLMGVPQTLPRPTSWGKFLNETLEFEKFRVTNCSGVGDLVLRVTSFWDVLAWGPDVPLSNPTFSVICMLAERSAIPENCQRGYGLKGRFANLDDEAVRGELLRPLLLLGMRSWENKLAGWTCSGFTDTEGWRKCAERDTKGQVPMTALSRAAVTDGRNRDQAHRRIYDFFVTYHRNESKSGLYSLDTTDNEAERNFVCFAAATRIMILHSYGLPMDVPSKDQLAFNYDAKDKETTAKLISELERTMCDLSGMKVIHYWRRQHINLDYNDFTIQDFLPYVKG